MQHNGKCHKDECKWPDQGGILETQTDQSITKQAGNSDQNNATWPSECHKNLFFERHPRPHQGQHHRQWTCNQDDRQDKRDCPHIKLTQRAEIKASGEQDKHARNQQNGRVFLKAAQFLIARQVRVRDHDAHDRHSQKATFMKHVVGHAKDCQQQRKQHWHLHILRDPATLE